MRGIASESVELAPVSGPSSIESFACYDRQSCSWRTSQPSAVEGSTEFSGTWPLAGTMRSGRAYAQPTLERPTDVDVSLSSRTVAIGPATSIESIERSWPTPTASHWGGRHTTTATGTMNSGTTLTDAMLIHHRQDRTRGPDGLVLHPEFVEALMGIRVGWTRIDDVNVAELLATRSARRKAAKLSER